jgi:hypothetical protein
VVAYKKIMAIGIAMLFMLASASAMAIPETQLEEDEIHDAVYYAYMDFESSPYDLQESILEARSEIIYSSDGWVADGHQGAIIDADGNIVRTLPQFHELFPEDWDLPVLSVENAEPGGWNLPALPVGSTEIEVDFLQASAETTKAVAASVANTYTPVHAGYYYLTNPPANTDSSPFWGYNSDSIGAIISATSLGYAQTFNAGLSNASGVSFGWAPDIPSGDGYWHSLSGAYACSI